MSDVAWFIRLKIQTWLRAHVQDHRKLYFDFCSGDLHVQSSGMLLGCCRRQLRVKDVVIKLLLCSALCQNVVWPSSLSPCNCVHGTTASRSFCYPSVCSCDWLLALAVEVGGELVLMAIVIGGAAGCAGTVAHPARKMGRSRNTKKKKKKKKTRKIHPV